MSSYGLSGWPGAGNGSTGSLGRSSTRFVPHDFRYNGRVAMALLPSLVVLAGFGGNAVSAALAVSLTALVSACVLGCAAAGKLPGTLPQPPVTWVPLPPLHCWCRCALAERAAQRRAPPTPLPRRLRRSA